MPLSLIKWLPLSFFMKLCKSPLLISNIVKGAVSGLRQFLATESSWKIMKNTFNFISTNWICYWQTRFCTYYAFSLHQMSDIREVWKYWPLKDGWFLFSFAKILQGRHFVVSGPKNFKLLADISFESSLENTVLRSLLLFLCVCN